MAEHEPQPGPLSEEDIDAIRSTVENLLQVPAVGRVVHYVSHGTPVQPDGSQAYASQCRAAIISAVYDENNPPPDPECATGADGAAWVGLAVLNPTGMFFHECVCQDDRDHAGGTWHWPERV